MRRARKSLLIANVARRKSSIADDLVLAPWWVSAGLAVAAYTLLPALLPSAMVRSGIVGFIAFALFALSAVSALRAWKTRAVLERQTGVDSLRDLPWKEFEDIIAEAFRRQGYAVEETLGGGADGGVDLQLRRNGSVTLVQCKRWRGKPVPVQVVREIYGIAAGRRAAGAKVVATTSFTSEAIAFANANNIELIDSNALLRLIRAVQQSGKIRVSRDAAEPDHLAPACPQCGAEMKLREAKRGPNAGQRFWGCSNYPRCKGTRAI